MCVCVCVCVQAALCDQATLIRSAFSDSTEAERLYRKALAGGPFSKALSIVNLRSSSTILPTFLKFSSADPQHVPSLCGLSDLLMVAPPLRSPGLLVGVEAESEAAEAEAAEAEAEALLRRALSMEVWGLDSRV